jgi:lipopolysaccharide transport system ATP-binding protein
MPAGLIRGRLQIPGGFLNDGRFSLDFMVVAQGAAQARIDPGLRFGIHDSRADGTWFGKVPGAIRPEFLKFPLERVGPL